jgi:ubiquinone/menaquinone biosynthesis C-methylase UbiE
LRAEAAGEQASVDVNRRWFVEYARRTIPPGGRVLDYGCGAADLVRLLLAAGSTRTAATSNGPAPTTSG